MIVAGSSPVEGTTYYIGEFMKLYGPYTRKDGRKHIILVDDDGNKTTKSYPRFLMEEYLGRPLLPEETIDHINNDFTDDRIENLQLLSLSDNNKKEMMRPERQRKIYRFICPACGQEAEKYLNQVLSNWKKKREGPYCSRTCAGKATYKNPWAKE